MTNRVDNNAKNRVKSKVKKKKWETPAITEVDILRRELMEEFGSGVTCTQTRAS